MADTLKDKIKKEIAGTCTCTGWADGKPQNPGWRLEKYGKEYNFSISPKEWSVIEDNFGNIEIKWITYSTPIAPAFDMLKSVLSCMPYDEDMLFLIKVADCNGKESKVKN